MGETEIREIDREKERQTDRTLSLLEKKREGSGPNLSHKGTFVPACRLGTWLDRVQPGYILSDDRAGKHNA